MNIKRLLATSRQMIQFVGLALISLTVGLVLAQSFTNVDAQDAFQYRQNLERGDYERQDMFGIWPIIVVAINTFIPDHDPFVLVGGVTAALFLFYSVNARPGWGRWAIFLVLLLMPLMSLNYGQVLRQGLAVAIIIAALMANSFVIMTGLLMLAATLHSVYAPFIALGLLRFYLFPSSAIGSGGQGIGRSAKRFDWMVFILIPLAFVTLIYAAPEQMIQKYFEFDADNVKRLLVSALILAFIILVYPVGNQRLTLFTTYFGLAVAFSLPFQNDYTRINTAIFPLLVFAALLCEKPRRSYYALGICFILTLYIGLRLDYN
ncbi:hypothetical protein MCEMAEM21_00071 [Oxalobacteraceae bacterium]